MAKKRPDVFDVKFFQEQLNLGKVSQDGLLECLIGASWTIEEIHQAIDADNLPEFFKLVRVLKDNTGKYGANDLHALCSKVLKANLKKPPHSRIFMKSILKKFFILKRSIRAFQVKQNLYNSEEIKKAS